MKKLFSVVLILCAITTGCRDQAQVTHVKVLDPDFKPITEITNSAVLAELNQIWMERSIVEPSPVHKFTHKVDILTSEEGTRWLYDPSGYATILSKVRLPIYEFKDPDKLKNILIPNPSTNSISASGGSE